MSQEQNKERVLWFKSVLLGVPAGEGGKRRVSMANSIEGARSWAYAMLSAEPENSPAFVRTYKVVEAPVEDLDVASIPKGYRPPSS
jgi:hypothetical protein